MKKLLILLMLMASIFAMGQATTNVTINVTDTDGQAWYGGNWSALLVPSAGSSQASGPPWFVKGTPTPFSNLSSNGLLDASGNATFTVAQNAALAPANSQWQITVCPKGSYGTQGCYVQRYVVSGASQSINMVPPGIRVNFSQPQYNVQLYQDIEATNMSAGQLYWNLGVPEARIYNGSAWVSIQGAVAGYTVVTTTIQNAINTACALSPANGVFIPPTYTGTDGFTNTCHTPIINGRSLSAMRGGTYYIGDFGAVGSAGYYDFTTCTSGSATFSLGATRGRLPLAGDTIRVAGCGPAGGLLTCVLSTGGGSPVCGGGVTASTSVSAGASAVWGPATADDTTAILDALNYVRLIGGHLYFDGIYGITSTLQVAPGPGQNTLQRITLDGGGKTSLVWLGADQTAMLQVGDNTNWGASTIRRFDFHTGANNRAIYVQIGYPGNSTIWNVVEQNEFLYNCYDGVRIANSWENTISDNRFYCSGTFNGASINHAAIYFGPAGVGPANAITVVNNKLDSYGQFGIKAETSGSGGAFTSHFLNNLIEGTTVWTQADVDINGGGNIWVSGYMELGSGAKEIGYTNFVNRGYGNYTFSFPVCTRNLSTNPSSYSFQAGNAPSCAIDNYLQVTLTRVAGAGTFAAGRDVYIKVTAKDTVRGAETNPTLIVYKIVNTVLNDQVQVTTNNWQDSTGNYTQFCVYEADVATGGGAPAQNLYKSVGACTAKGGTSNVNTTAAGAALRPDLWWYDEGSTGNNIFENVPGRVGFDSSCLYDMTTSSYWSGYYGCKNTAYMFDGSFYSLGSPGERVFPNDVNADFYWSYAPRHDIAGRAHGIANNSSGTVSPDYPTGNFGTNGNKVPFAAIIYNRGFNPGGAFNRNIAWMCKNTAGCATNPTVVGDWVRVMEYHLGVHTDCTAVPAAWTWAVGDTCDNTSPTNFIEKWINVAAGTPGTFLRQPITQTATASGCATAASVGATCTTVVTWPVAFPDNNYKAVCDGNLITSGVPVNGGQSAQAAASVTVQTVAMTAVAAQFTNVRCAGWHD